MLAIGSNPKPNYQIANGTAPSTGKGPQTIAMVLDFTTGTVIHADLVEERMAGMIGLVQSIFIDNRNNASSFSINFSGTNQTLYVDAGQQACLPVIAPNSLRFTASTAGGVAVPVDLMDTPMPYFTSGLVQVSIAGGGGGALPVNPVQAVTLVKTALALSGADQTLVAANVARESLQIFAPTANVNPVQIAFGGATGAAGTDWEITPGGFWQAPAGIVTRQAVHVKGTAADNIIAYEG